MQFLHGLKVRHWKIHLWRNLRCLNGRKSFEQMMNLVWVGLGNLQEISSPCIYLFIFEVFSAVNMTYDYASIHIMGLGVCFIFLSFWESTSKQRIWSCCDFGTFHCPCVGHLLSVPQFPHLFPASRGCCYTP